ncbi:MAG: hypothetical protein JXR10_17875, partial [Cyclobacteriaceae bacterium]
MKRYLPIIAFVFSFQLSAQTYILNEDFSSASEATPPSNWTNTTVTGGAADLWRFDNLGQRTVEFPFVGKFSIFDGQTQSNNGSPEEVSLETPFLDCSSNADILLIFDHVFVGDNGGQGEIEVWDGAAWNLVETYSTNSSGIENIKLNISAYAGNNAASKVRFVWSGNNSMYWALDNVQVYAPLALDAALEKIDNPNMPFGAGNQDIQFTLTNFGANTLTSATINWSVGGVSQTAYEWTGNLAIGESLENITIGSFNFAEGRVNEVVVTVASPNGDQDLNSQNNSVTSNLTASLCGTYT